MNTQSLTDMLKEHDAQRQKRYEELEALCQANFDRLIQTCDNVITKVDIIIEQIK
jgi:hypothetical protein